MEEGEGEQGTRPVGSGAPPPASLGRRESSPALPHTPRLPPRPGLGGGDTAGRTRLWRWPRALRRYLAGPPTARLVCTAPAPGCPGSPSSGPALAAALPLARPRSPPAAPLTRRTGPWAPGSLVAWPALSIGLTWSVGVSPLALGTVSLRTLISLPPFPFLWGLGEASHKPL